MFLIAKIFIIALIVYCVIGTVRALFQILSAMIAIKLTTSALNLMPGKKNVEAEVTVTQAAA
jgi:hypothetical protein